MELENLKHAWKETKGPAHEQETLTPEMLKNMNNQNYRSKMKKIMMPEIAGSIVCLASAAFIGFNFNKLDTSILQIAGTLSILLLLLLPAISFLSTWKLNKVDNVNRPYAETLQSFAIQKIRFVKLQKLNVGLSYLLLVSVIVLISKFLGGKDISGNKDYWLYSFTIGFIFLLFYSRWVEKYYRKSLLQAEDLLKELAA